MISFQISCYKNTCTFVQNYFWRDFMPNYLEIIRLHELSFSQRKICETVGSGRTLVKRTIDTAKQNQLSY